MSRHLWNAWFLARAKSPAAGARYFLRNTVDPDRIVFLLCLALWVGVIWTS